MLGHRALTFQDYTTILKRRWWIIAIPAIIFPLVGFGITFLVQPEYISQTLVLVEQQKVPESYVKAVVTEDLSGRLASVLLKTPATPPRSISTCAQVRSAGRLASATPVLLAGHDHSS